MDNIEERRFVLKSIDYIFKINNISTPSCIKRIMDTLDCRHDTLFDSSMEIALTQIIKNQKPVKERIYKQDLEAIYRRKVVETFTERDFLEFLCYNIVSSLLEAMMNPYVAVEKYRTIMSVVIQAKARNRFTKESHSKLKATAEDLKEESIQRAESREYYHRLMIRPRHSRAAAEPPSTSSEARLVGTQGLKRKLTHDPTESKLLKIDSKKQDEVHANVDCESIEATTSSVSESRQMHENGLQKICDKIKLVKDQISNSIEVYRQSLEDIENRKYRLVDLVDSIEEIEDELNDLELPKSSEVRKKSL